MADRDPYSVLGLTPKATSAEITKAYRKLARKHHPDVNRSSDANHRMAELNAAHGVLSDPVQRKAWDAEQAARAGEATSGFATATASTHPGWNEGFHFTSADLDEEMPHDIFDQLARKFSHMQQRQAEPVAMRGADRHTTIELDLRETYNGVEKMISVQTLSGGALNGHGGDKLQVTIPSGVYEGQHIRLAGRGDAGSGGAAAGDLYLKVHIRPDVQWRTVGRDVYGGPVWIAPWEAALGTLATVRTPNGSAEVHIPKGWKAGRTLRIKGHGIPGARDAKAGTDAQGGKGDLYLKLEVALPPADNDAAQEAYRNFAHAFPAFEPRTV